LAKATRERAFHTENLRAVVNRDIEKCKKEIRDLDEKKLAFDELDTFLDSVKQLV
jgi:hypothetical protein